MPGGLADVGNGPTGRSEEMETARPDLDFVTDARLVFIESHHYLVGPKADTGETVGTVTLERCDDTVHARGWHKVPVVRPHPDRDRTRVCFRGHRELNCAEVDLPVRDIAP